MSGRSGRVIINVRAIPQGLWPRRGLELTLYDPRDLPTLAEKLLGNRDNALIVGHSNTTPDLTRLLCQCDISDMDESEYDQLYVVSVLRDETKVEILRQSLLFER